MDPPSLLCEGKRVRNPGPADLTEMCDKLGYPLNKEVTTSYENVE